VQRRPAGVEETRGGRRPVENSRSSCGVSQTGAMQQALLALRGWPSMRTARRGRTAVAWPAPAGADRDKSGSRDPHWFTALEDTMARHGVALAAARADTVHRLDAAAAGYRPFPRRRWPWPARSTAGSPPWPRSNAEDRLRGELAAGRLRDAEPHHILWAASQRSCRAPSRSRPAGSRGLDASRRRSWCHRVAHAAWWRCRRPCTAAAARRDARTSTRAPRGAFGRCGALRPVWMTGTDAELFAPLASRAQVLERGDGLIAALDPLWQEPRT